MPCGRGRVYMYASFLWRAMWPPASAVPLTCLRRASDVPALWRPLSVPALPHPLTAIIGVISSSLLKQSQEKFGHGTICSPYVRKNTGSFGWDCARAFVAQGLWKSVWIRSVPPKEAVVDMVVPIVTGSVTASSPSLIGSHNNAADPDNTFHVEVRVMVVSNFGGVPTPVTVWVEGSWSDAPKGTKMEAMVTNDTHIITINVTATNVELWWPNGEGAQTLHTIRCAIQVHSEPIGPVTITTIGFRTFELMGSVGNSTPLHNGVAPLWFKVNGRPVYAKGHNWMPSSVLIADDAADQANKRARMRDAVSVHANTIRVWGGGIYETDTFYRAADELGIMIMQDG
jgi:beta-mannosidase